MWQRKFRIILVSMLAFIGLTACTPSEIAIWNQLSPVQQQQYISSQNPTGSHRELGRQMAYAAGYSVADFECLDNIINRESSWYIVANQGGSSAFGIPQAMLSVHRDINNPTWKSSPTLQIQWLLSYVKGRYGSACSAWAYKSRVGWY